MTSALTTRPSRRRGVLLASGSIAALGLVAAGCGGGSGTGASTSRVAGFIPATAPMYGEISTDLEGPQWTQLMALAKKFPAYGEIVKKIADDPKGAIALTTIKPLLGDHAAFGIAALPDVAGDAAGLAKGNTPDLSSVQDDAPVVLAAEIAKGKGKDVTNLLLVSGKMKPLGTHDGTQYFGDDEMKVAVVDDVLVAASTEADLFKSLDAHAAGGDRTIAGRKQVGEALAKLPSDVFMQAYVDIQAIMTAATKANPASAAGLKALNLAPNAAVALSVSAEPDGVRLKTVQPGVPNAAGVKDFTPKLIANVPGDAIAYVGLSNLTAQFRSTLDKTLAADPNAQRQLDAFATTLPGLLGVSIDDVSSLAAGEHAFVVTKGGAVPNVAAILQQADGARAAKTLATVRTKAPALASTFGQSASLPAFREVDLGGGLTGWSVPLPKSGQVPVDIAPTYAVDGNLVLAGLTPEAVKAVRRPVSTLTSNALYSDAAKQVPDAVTSVAWVNVPEGVKTVESFARSVGQDPFATADGKKVRANLAPIKSVIAWSTGGDEPSSEAFVTIR